MVELINDLRGAQGKVRVPKMGWTLAHANVRNRNIKNHSTFDK